MTHKYQYGVYLAGGHPQQSSEAERLALDKVVMLISVI